MLPRAQRLDTAAFSTAFDRGRAIRHPLLTVRAHRRHDGDPVTRAAFVVSKKHGKATLRNRIRRRLREQYRLSEVREMAGLQGCDLIFLAGAAAIARAAASLSTHRAPGVPSAVAGVSMLSLPAERPAGEARPAMLSARSRL